VNVIDTSKADMDKVDARAPIYAQNRNDGELRCSFFERTLLLVRQSDRERRCSISDSVARTYEAAKSGMSLG
jgi:hypothetical protein